MLIHGNYQHDCACATPISYRSEWLKYLSSMSGHTVSSTWLRRTPNSIQTSVLFVWLSSDWNSDYLTHCSRASLVSEHWQTATHRHLAATLTRISTSTLLTAPTIYGNENWKWRVAKFPIISCRLTNRCQLIRSSVVMSSNETSDRWTWEEAEALANDKAEWRRRVAQCSHLDAGWTKV